MTCWIVLTVGMTVRLTVLDAGYDGAALDRADAYERIYTQVLPDPQVASVTRNLLAGIDVAPSVVTDNVRLLLPPATLRDVTHLELAALTEYLLGRSRRLDVLEGLAPVTDRLASTAGYLLRAVLAGEPHQPVADVKTFRLALNRFVQELTEGHVPRALPAIALGPDVAEQVTSAVLAPLDPAERGVLGPQVRTLLAGGDLSSALTLVAPIFYRGPALGSEQLQSQVTDAVATLQAPTQRLRDRAEMRVLAQTRAVTAFGTWTFFVIVLSLFLAATITAVALAQATGGRPVRTLATTLTTVSGLTAAAGLLLGITVPDPLRRLSAAKATPTSFAAVLTDVDDQLRSGMRHTFLLLVLVPVLAAMLIALVPAIARVARTRTWSVVRRLARPWSVALTVLTVLAVSAVLATPTASGTVRCEGSARLCDRAYTAVAYLAAHNAMSSSDAHFLGADQDPDLIGQLDAGVRDLMIDTHYWTTPAEISAFLNRLPASTRELLRPLVQGLSTPRPGVWLCHGLCQLGALSAVTELRRVGTWLADNPDEVLTLDIEDHTTVADTERAVLDAGLRRFLFTPPDVADGDWPTLREMIDSGHRLVVFSEQHDDPDGWFRNLFRYAAETPWEQTDAGRLTCGPGRGPATAALFLLNHYVTGVAPSRRDAAILNRPSSILSTAARCTQERGMRPTFVAVDFVTTGDPLRAVYLLNGVP